MKEGEEKFPITPKKKKMKTSAGKKKKGVKRKPRDDATDKTYPDENKTAQDPDIQGHRHTKEQDGCILSASLNNSEPKNLTKKSRKKNKKTGKAKTRYQAPLDKPTASSDTSEPREKNENSESKGASPSEPVSSTNNTQELSTAVVTVPEVESLRAAAGRSSSVLKSAIKGSALNANAAHVRVREARIHLIAYFEKMKRRWIALNQNKAKVEKTETPWFMCSERFEEKDEGIKNRIMNMVFYDTIILNENPNNDCANKD
jgi:hypothetical protein